MAIGAVTGAGTRVEEVRFVLFDRSAYVAFERVLGGAGPASAHRTGRGSPPGGSSILTLSELGPYR